MGLIGLLERNHDMCAPDQGRIPSGFKVFSCSSEKQIVDFFDFLLFIVIVINGEGIRLIKRFEHFEVEVKF